jgi:hypothetical protein
VVQDMAVETLLKICNKCKRKFVILHPTETQPFVAELLATLHITIKDLKTHQVNMFYESVALMIRAETDEQLRQHYLVRRYRSVTRTRSDAMGCMWVDQLQVVSKCVLMLCCGHMRITHSDASWQVR